MLRENCKAEIKWVKQANSDRKKHYKFAQQEEINKYCPEHSIALKEKGAIREKQNLEI